MSCIDLGCLWSHHCNITIMGYHTVQHVNLHYNRQNMPREIELKAKFGGKNLCVHLNCKE